jgi:hypothetical protein
VQVVAISMLVGPSESSMPRLKYFFTSLYHLMGFTCLCVVLVVPGSNWSSDLWHIRDIVCLNVTQGMQSWTSSYPWVIETTLFIRRLLQNDNCRNFFKPIKLAKQKLMAFIKLTEYH